MDYDNKKDQQSKGECVLPDENKIALDDERRVKVLSPSLLVFRRFIRNKLAITGSIFIIAMFLFSFVGGWIMPYSESQIFTKHQDMSKEYAGVTENTEFRYTEVEGSEFPLSARAQFVQAVTKGDTQFSFSNSYYMLEAIHDRAYQIYGLKDVALAAMLGGNYTVSKTDGFSVAGFDEDFIAALENKADSFESAGVTYIIQPGKKNYTAYVAEPLALATMDIFDFASADADSGYDFRYEAETAIADMEQRGLTDNVFTVNGKQYTIKNDDGSYSIYIDENGEQVLYTNVSEYVIQAIYPDIFLTLDFKDALKEAIAEGRSTFTAQNEDGSIGEFTVERENHLWTVRWQESTEVIDSFAAPSATHLLGTDGNGMDVLTRLMYGGRVSLIIGFIVVLIELIIGVIIGGIAGYFGKWIDNLLMRIVDIFNCIPSLPLIIIIGAVMDGMRMDPQLRMVWLMVILGVLGWPGVARLVRGQILSLREQEFMVAAEATGLSVNRRIFRHLVPNVIPQLIVFSTLSLGNIIILESTLSFLGLGVKFPFASWGNIINAVSNVYVMTNFLFVWIPAGLCIIITVLGFNFIGDGLRDAFDPKMKR